MLPEDLKYSKEHEWVRVDGDNGKVGITNFAQEQLGDVVFVELPEVGAKVKAMEIFGNIESVKAVSELFAPISGQVLEVNQMAMDAPELVNKDPYGEAWLLVIQMDEPSELDKLFSASEYQEYLDKEESP